MKTNKLRFYSQHLMSNLLPQAYYRHQLQSELAGLNEYDRDEIENRVNYYLKAKQTFRLPLMDACQASRFHLKHNKSAYYYDLLSCLRYFPDDLKFSYRFGDIRDIPEHPSFVKSRPICEHNENSVLFKLNSVRHFNFVRDPYRFEDKKDLAIFRGACHQSQRQRFLEACINTPKTDIGDTRKNALGTATYRQPISIREHMKCKFIISVEGNDVASNLKWILNSNSLCFMTRPRFETWFMEGTLIPDHHYVLLRDDYADLAEKIDYYSQHHAEARHIIYNAQTFARQFQDSRKEKLISLLVMKHYLSLCNPAFSGAAITAQQPVSKHGVLAHSLSQLAD